MLFILRRDTALPPRLALMTLAEVESPIFFRARQQRRYNKVHNLC